MAKWQNLSVCPLLMWSMKAIWSVGKALRVVDAAATCSQGRGHCQYRNGVNLRHKNLPPNVFNELYRSPLYGFMAPKTLSLPFRRSRNYSTCPGLGIEAWKMTILSISMELGLV